MKSKCMTCGKEIDLDTEFKDALSAKEYRISGMCQECQDKTFVEPEEEEDGFECVDCGCSTPDQCDECGDPCCCDTICEGCKTALMEEADMKEDKENES